MNFSTTIFFPKQHSHKCILLISILHSARKLIGTYKHTGTHPNRCNFYKNQISYSQVGTFAFKLLQISFQLWKKLVYLYRVSCSLCAKQYSCQWCGWSRREDYFPKEGNNKNSTNNLSHIKQYLFHYFMCFVDLLWVT